MYMYREASTLGKSSDQSPGNINISSILSNIPKLFLIQRKVLYTRSKFSNNHCHPSIYPVSTAKKDGYPYVLTSHKIIQFI